MLDLDELARGNLLRQTSESAGVRELAREHAAAAVRPYADRAQRFTGARAEEIYTCGSDALDFDRFGVEPVVHDQLDTAIVVFVLPGCLATFHDSSLQIRGNKMDPIGIQGT